MKKFNLMIASLRKQFKSGGSPFQFHDPGRLIDDDLQLLLCRTRQGDARRGITPEYIFDMVSHCDNNSLMGRISLRIGHTEHIEKYAGHIGYTVEPPYRGRRLAARSCLLITPLARSHGINPLWITCNPENTASRRTCEIIGSKLVETIQIPPNDPLYYWDTKWKCRYRLDL
tara:strand:- start:255 stop:770 length:516 start_codon:yes stop_codon:yes gene_type:complete